MLDQIKSKNQKLSRLHFQKRATISCVKVGKKDDAVMAISNGLDPDKPDHQHGDMLGYKPWLMVKLYFPIIRFVTPWLRIIQKLLGQNVALVDNELQGQGYASNQRR
jgi:hypothetical protein